MDLGMSQKGVAVRSPLSIVILIMTIYGHYVVWVKYRFRCVLPCFQEVRDVLSSLLLSMA